VSQSRESVYTVGQIRELLKDLPDEHPIRCQVAASDGSAWNMCMSMRVMDGGFVHARMYHDQLKSLSPVRIED
jgi:hypothetical protein